jgi:sec-independent protein translocase protein TatA
VTVPDRPTGPARVFPLSAGIRAGRPLRMTAMNLGAPELMIVLLVVLVLFGGSKLPKLARSVGEAQREFRSGMQQGFTQDDEPSDAS